MRKSMSIIVLMILFIVLFIGAFEYMSLKTDQSDSDKDTDEKTADLIISDNQGSRISFNVEIADTPEEQRTGLMNRSSLDDGSGMLFVFDGSEYRTFWMENTLIPLDIIFISSDNEIIDIHKNATPLDRTTITSSGPCKYVLEINGGLCERLSIHDGDTVDILR